MCSFPSPTIDRLVDHKQYSSEDGPSSFIFTDPNPAVMPRTSRPPMRVANTNEVNQRSRSAAQNRSKTGNPHLLKESFMNESSWNDRNETDFFKTGRLRSVEAASNGYDFAERIYGGSPTNPNQSSVELSVHGEFGQSPPSSSPGLNGHDEFFDAAEDDLSECVSDDESAKSQVFGRSPSSRGLYRDVAGRLHEEIVRRVAAEEALTSEKQKRKELLTFLNSIGASIPAAFLVPEQNGKDDEGRAVTVNASADTPGTVEDKQTQVNSNLDVVEGEGLLQNEGEEMQEVIVARLVSAAIARGVAAAMAKEELERVVAQKEKEMSRLRDKMQFWERMNEELSNQTQENVEIQRMRRKRRQRMQKVILAGLGVVLGVACSAGIAYAFSTLETGAVSSGAGNKGAAGGGDVVTQTENLTDAAVRVDSSVVHDQQE